MDILGGIKKALNIAQPIRPASEAVGKALKPVAPPADPTGFAAAKARGDAAYQAAVNRGKVVNTPTGELSIKKF